MSVNDFTVGFSQVQIGDRISGGGSDSARMALLGAGSSDSIEAGFGVDLASGAVGSYKPLCALPTSAGEFLGVVPRSAIPTTEEAALLGSTAGDVAPGTSFGAYRYGRVRVPIIENVTANAAAFLVISGANQGKWGVSDGGTQPVYLLELTSSGSDSIGFTATIGGVAGVSLARTSTTQAADALDLAAQWNSDAFYSDYGVATVDGNDDVVITGNALTAITFTDDSTVGNSIADSNTTALVAATAKAIPGAFFRATTTGASGAGDLELLR